MEEHSVYTRSREQWVRIPPEAAHFSLEKKSLFWVLLCCIVLLCMLSPLIMYFSTQLFMFQRKGDDITSILISDGNFNSVGIPLSLLIKLTRFF